MPKFNPGVNDLVTLYPEIASEADGWNPSLVSSGSHKKLQWRCKFGHTWTVSPNARTNNNSKCPICSNRRVWTGFNDLLTLFPESENFCHGWDPSKILSNSSKVKEWKCEKGHIWDSVVSETVKFKFSCPVCSGRRIVKGVNDLESCFPEIAKQIIGEDPSKIYKYSHSTQEWVCNLNHTWKASVRTRTKHNFGCPYCGNKKLLSGFNDLKTTRPDLASSAYGWDPSTVIHGSSKAKEWICERGHIWKTKVYARMRSGCPYCTNRLVLFGFNDLKTKYPELAKQANGWDPSIVLPGSSKRLEWKCDCGCSWKTTPNNRTSNYSNCPACCGSGYNLSNDGWMYFCRRGVELQIGITNNPLKRLNTHEKNGWTLIEIRGPGDGRVILELEKELKKFIRNKVGLIEGYYENWLSSNLNPKSLKELIEKAEIKSEESRIVLNLEYSDINKIRQSPIFSYSSS